MQSDPELFKDYNRGIIRVRSQFLEWTSKGEGLEKWNEARAGGGNAKASVGPPAFNGKPKKWVLVPAAIPGSAASKVTLLVLLILVALAVAIALAFLLDYLDDRLRTKEDVTDLFQLPVYAEVLRSLAAFGFPLHTLSRSR